MWNKLCKSAYICKALKHKKMNNNTKLVLAVIGVSAIAAYLASKNKQNSTTKNYAGNVGNRLGFASSAYVNKGDMYNNNLRFGTGWIGNKKSMTGAPTFFTNKSEKLNY
jgi:hypothetical protein